MVDANVANELVVIRADDTPGPKHSMTNTKHNSSMALSLSDIVVEEEVVEVSSHSRTRTNRAKMNV